MTHKRTVGIDFGTTRSAIAHVVGGEPETIENASGNDVTPSVVQVADGEVVVGEEAANAEVLHPDKTVSEVKRDVGEDTNYSVDGESYTPAEIASLVIEKVVDDAEDRLGQDLDSAVITVPAYFNDNERTVVENAGRIAGLDVEKLLPEPSAAALAHGVRQGKLAEDGECEDELVFVFDLGGGTFDVSLVDVNYEFNTFETLNTDGDTDLGGADWTTAVVDWIAEKTEAETGVDVRDDAQQFQRVRQAAIEAKHALSSRSSYDIAIPFLVSEADYNFEETLTRERFDELTADLLELTRDPIESLFEASDHTLKNVDEVVLVGGATRMPQVEEFVSEYFGRDPSTNVSPDEAVAMGAAIQAEIVDSAVGGADLLPGSEYGLTLTDVVPQPIGVEVYNPYGPGKFCTLVERDEAIPLSVRRDTFATVGSRQTSVEISIYQGDGEIVDDEELEHIGTAVLEDIPTRNPTEESLGVELAVNSNGTVEVEGRDLISGETIHATFENALQMGDEEIEESRETLPEQKA